jgi:hypothetical protein
MIGYFLKIKFSLIFAVCIFYYSEPFSFVEKTRRKDCVNVNRYWMEVNKKEGEYPLLHIYPC